MSVESILVADDDDLCRELLVETLDGAGHTVKSCRDGCQAIEWLQREEFDVVITDLKMPGADGIEVLEHAKRLQPACAVLLTTAYATVEVAVKAMRRGAEDFLLKPFSPDQVLLALERIERTGRLSSENRYLKRELLEADGDPTLVGDHPSIKQLLATIRIVAKSKATVLIQGESGTGKELVARMLHAQSPRADGPFVRVNCAALSETLLESELFGHERGAFTGAVARREGRFELAHRGTLLLDEISEIAPSLQSKLLRVLEEEEFERVGGSRTIKIDVRIVGTTNRDLRAAIDDGEFRQDLYYRLNVVPISIPPLRERSSDIPILARHFLEIYAAQNGSPARELLSETIDLLMRYEWPGNVRELRNVIQRAVVLGKEKVIRPEQIALGSTKTTSAPAIAVGMTVAEVEREVILKTLEETGYNRTAAASILGLTPRTLSNKIRLYRAEGYEILGGRKNSCKAEVG
ncbi:MAG: sigma-54 dependent transcriptional regulator [Planctomycetota bacterium]